MTAWLSKLRDSLSGREADADAVRRVIQQAHSGRTRIELIETAVRAETDTVMQTTIEQVRAGDFVVSRPSVGAKVRPLATGGDLRIIVCRPGTRLIGSTKSLGRVKVPAGGGGVFYGYRLRFPDRFEPEPVAEQPAFDIGDDALVEAELSSFDLPNPIHGVIEEINAVAARLRCRNAYDKISPGDKAYLKVQLPEPVGMLTEMVRIGQVELSDEDRQIILSVAFENPVNAIHELHSSARSRRVGQQRKAG